MFSIIQAFFNLNLNVLVDVNVCDCASVKTDVHFEQPALHGWVVTNQACKGLMELLSRVNIVVSRWRRHIGGGKNPSRSRFAAIQLANIGFTTNDRNSQIICYCKVISVHNPRHVIGVPSRDKVLYPLDGAWAQSKQSRKTHVVSLKYEHTLKNEQRYRY